MERNYGERLAIAASGGDVSSKDARHDRDLVFTMM